MSKMQTSMVSIPETENPIKSPEILSTIHERTLIGRNPAGISKRVFSAIWQHKPRVAIKANVEL